MEVEITQKIREAIIRKLVDFDAFVDDELPDYIMVLVANKKTKKQMENDLALFLGKNTSAFTNWLQETLQSNSANAADASSRSENVENVSDSQESESEVDEVDIKVPNEVLGDKPIEDKAVALTEKPKNVSVTESNDEVVSGKIQENQVIGDLVPQKNVSVSQSKKEKHRTTSKELFVQQALSETHYVSKPCKPLFKSAISSVKEAVKDITDIEYDPQNPSYLGLKSVASKVSSLYDRRMMHQANKLLLLKAVEDANKSILGKQNLDEIYKPTPIKVLSNAKRNTVEKTVQADVKSPVEKKADLRNFLHETSKQRSLVMNQVRNKTVSIVNRPNLLCIQTQLPEEDDYEFESFNVKNPSREVFVTNYRRKDESVNTDADIEMDVPNLDMKPPSPHFVVTLDGLDLNSVKRKWNEVTVEEIKDKEDIENVDTHNASEKSFKKQKLLERCRFWPSCKNGDECEFHHPTIQCTTFPNCKFGDKCLYVHPNCKYDSLCSRKDCPYTHSHKRELLKTKVSLGYAPQSPYPVHTSPAYAVPTCKYFPNCSSYKCPYLHPKKCRFGSECQSPTCMFVHPSFPARKQLKWTAELSL